MYTEWANDIGPTFKVKSAWLVRARPVTRPRLANGFSRSPQHPDSLVTADPVALAHIFTKVGLPCVFDPRRPMHAMR
jgi:hypothetical protein